MANIDRAAENLYEHRIRTADFPDGPTAWGDLPESWREEWREAAQALADAALITPDPTIIRTVEELEALDPDTVLQRRAQYPGHYSRTEHANDLLYIVSRWGTDNHLPAVVVCEGAEVRAARKALEEA